jgi:hypothetical protein
LAIPLSEATLRLLDGRNYAVLATVNPDGSPQTSVMWVGRDGADLLYVELRGRVTMTPDVGRAVDTQLSWKYDGKDPGADRPGAVRVVVRMTIEKAAGYAA